MKPTWGKGWKEGPNLVVGFQVFQFQTPEQRDLCTTGVTLSWARAAVPVGK